MIASIKETVTVNDELKKKMLRNTLRALNASSADIEASATISTDGLMIASVLSEGTDADRFGAMCASLLALADRAAQEIARGTLKQVLIEGEKGVMLLVYAGRDSVLAVAARPSVNLGMVFIEARKTAAKIEETLSGGSGSAADRRLV
jgi:predicted regulator of Ras-like GTPase activity (Roadblock/LC7/MglB family)